MRLSFQHPLILSLLPLWNASTSCVPFNITLTRMDITCSSRIVVVVDVVVNVVDVDSHSFGRTNPA